jgi:hypothetical protein
VQLQSLTKQGVIGAFIANSDPLTADELEQLDKWGKIAFNFLKNEWLMAQKDDFIQNRYLPAFRAAINPSMSSYTVKQVYDYTISEGVLEATAKLIHKEAVSIYHGELNG